MTRAVAGLHAPEAAPLLGQGAPQVGAGAMAVALVRGLELVAARELVTARGAGHGHVEATEQQPGRGG